MRCNKARETLSLQLDGMMPPAAAVELEKHLESCRECQAYRDDLRVSRRLLAATEPELPENFDWKLQLRLNQTLKEAAGEVAFPWEPQRADRFGWLRNFGAATAVGMAAVLTVALFVGPFGASDPATSPGFAERSLTSPSSPVSDRLPLSQTMAWSGLRANGLRQQPVSGMSALPVSSRLQLDRGWSGSNAQDLVTINRLRNENRRLFTALQQTQWQLRQMQAQLDTSGQKALDLPE